MSPQRLHDSPERAAALRRRVATAAGQAEAADGPTPHPLLALQRQVGNAQVERMLAQREGEEQEEVAAQHDLAQREGEEEEEVAAQHDTSTLHRADCGCGACTGSDTAQAKPEVGMEGGPLSSELAGRINSARGGGAPLDTGTRTTMEQSFGTSFADVRLHTDAESNALNRSISAKAFTIGNDIFFRQDTSPSDQGLLAHELTHVVQQRSLTPSGSLRVGPAGDSHEQHADTVSSAVTSGAASSAAAHHDADEALAQRMLAQRQEEEELEE